MIAGTFAVAATVALLVALRPILASLGLRGPAIDATLIALGILTCGIYMPAGRSLRSAQLSARSAAGDVAEARVHASKAAEAAHLTWGIVATILVCDVFVGFLVVNNVAVGKTFFLWPLIRSSAPLILSAFWVNIRIFVVAEVLVLAWGLCIAVARLTPGAPGRPIRAIATLYVDVFRGMPAIISIYLIGFGLPLTDLPVIRDLQPSVLATIALTLTYGAYVSEVYRSGIEGVHRSQTAAARSLGLSHFQTLRHIIVPQAVRGIVPPLLNEFITLQKDTALVNVIGAVDCFNQAKIIASNHFNLSAVTTVALLFVVITIPQARFVDRMVERDHRRNRSGIS